MGLTDATLLPLLLSFVKRKDFILPPRVLIVDLMCNLHQMINVEVTSLTHLFNCVMAGYMEELCRPDSSIEWLWVSVDRPEVPLIKSDTKKKRAASAEGKSNTLPYPPATRVSEHGQLLHIAIAETSSASAGEFARWELKKEITPIQVSRLCSSRELRKWVFVFWFTRLAPLLSRHLPSGKTIVFSYSDDPLLSPVIVRSELDAPLDMKERWFNRWLEADWDQSRGLDCLLHYLQGSPRTISVLACAYDGDMYGIWSLFVSHLKHAGQCKLYFWNMNSSDNKAVVCMNDFEEKLRKEHRVTAHQFAVFMHTMGNDYTDKKLLTPGVGAEVAWPRFCQYAKTRPACDLTSDVKSFELLLDAMISNPRGYKSKTKAQLAALAARTPDQLEDQLERLKAGVRAWSSCAISAGPMEGDRLLMAPWRYKPKPMASMPVASEASEGPQAMALDLLDKRGYGEMPSSDLSVYLNEDE